MNVELVKFAKTVKLPVTKTLVIKLVAGKSYIMAQAIARQISDIFGKDHIKSQVNFESIYGNKRYNGQSLDGKKIAIWRTGGAGDLLFLSPSLKKLKETFPTVSITLGTSAKYIGIFDNFPFVDKKVVLPFEETAVQEADYYCTFEGIIERNKKAEELNAYDLFAERLGVLHLMEPEDKVPIVCVSDSDKSWATSIVASGGHVEAKGNIGIQVASSAVIRTFDAEKLTKVADELLAYGFNIFLLGGPNNTEQINLLMKSMKSTRGVINVADKGASWLKSAAIIEQMNLIITPDSSLTHMAVAMNTPVLGLYGPFKSNVRMKYYKNAVAIDANAICQPCFTHGQLPCKWVTDNDSLCSKCFDCIQPGLIVDIAKQMLKQ